MVDYENWDQLDQFKIRYAACLWCGVQPTNSWLLDKINFPQIIPVYEMLEQACQAGDLKTNNSIKVDTEHLLSNFEGFAGEIVAKSELTRFALERGQSPAFLFPNERNKSAAAVEPEPEPDEPKPVLPSSLSADVDKIYSTRVADYRKEHERRPTIKEDEVWQKAVGISRPRMRELRNRARLKDEEKGGAPRRLKKSITRPK